MKQVPVYAQSGRYAREHGELDMYRASQKADEECKNAIETAIRENFDGMHLNTACVRKVSDRYGRERMMRILAITVLMHEGDMRISRENRMWAQTRNIISNPDGFGADRNVYLAVNSHPGLIDMFLTHARLECCVRGGSHEN